MLDKELIELLDSLEVISSVLDEVLDIFNSVLDDDFEDFDEIELILVDE